MKVLIACEESQAVTKAFRALGHEAYSCDLLTCSGGHPEWHIQGSALKPLKEQKWDIVIAHPPCTRLANSGVTWLAKRNLWARLNEAAAFFQEFIEYGKAGNAIAIENPIPHKYATALIGKYSQIVQPWMFGHPESKATCLWLFNLPKLEPTNNVHAEMKALPKKEAQRIHYIPPGPQRATLRSKTFQGLADAIAQQYSDYLTARPGTK